MSGVRPYLDLLASSGRIQGMRAGLREAIRPGDRVLEIGTGLGTYAMFAAEAGAAVVAVDRDPIIHVAESAALAAGLAERITFVRGSFPEVAYGGAGASGDATPVPPFDAPFDVVVFEDYPGLMMDRGTHAVLAAAERLMAPAGRIVPGRVRLVVAAVENADLASRLVPGDGAVEGTPLDPDLLRGFMAHEPLRTQISPRYHVSAPLTTEPIAPLPAPGGAEVQVRGALTPGRACRVHALVAWFDLEVAEGRWVSNGPAPTHGDPTGLRTEEQPWGQYALPVHPPLDVPEGGVLEISAGPGGRAGEAPGPWRWEVRCGAESRRGDQMAGRPMGPPDLEP